MLITAVFLLTGLCSLASAQSTAPASVKLATCMNDSGLFDRIMPDFTSETGIQVDVIACGTGRALELAKAGDIDVAIVHDPGTEIQFIEDGYGLARYYVAQNEYAIVGPQDDPANIAFALTVADAFKAIMDSESTFISRGDNSAINIRELEIWSELEDAPSNDWYIICGPSTIGQLLTMADEMQAYTLVDTGTYWSMADKIGIKILYPASFPSGEEMLLNVFSIVTINPELNPDINQENVQALIDWLTGPEGRERVSNDQMNGHALYYVNPDGYGNEPVTSGGN